MKNWYREDWQFEITVLSVGRENRAEACRLGFEPGDKFHCHYQCPTGFCPKCLLQVFPLLEAVRAGGDLRQLGGVDARTMELVCPDGVVRLRVSGSERTGKGSRID